MTDRERAEYSDKKVFMKGMDRDEFWKKYQRVEFQRAGDRGVGFAKGGKITYYSNQTSKDFQLGELVYDTGNMRYGTIIGIYPESIYEVRLDSDGMQPTENLRKLRDTGDRGTKKQLFEAVASIERLRREYPQNGYPELINNPFYAKGGKVKFDTDVYGYNAMVPYLGENYLVEFSEPNPPYDSVFISDMSFRGLDKNTSTAKNIYFKMLKEKSKQKPFEGAFEKGGKIDKKDNNNMLLGGLAGILFGIFTIK